MNKFKEFTAELKSINFRQPKYVIPIFIYSGALYLTWLFWSKDNSDQDTDAAQSFNYINSDLPDAQIKGDGLGGKYESMERMFGKVQDYSAVENIDLDGDEEEKEEYESKYSQEEADNIEADRYYREQLSEMQNRLQRSYDRGNSMDYNNNNNYSYNSSPNNQQETVSELQRALAEARLKNQKPVEVEKPVEKKKIEVEEEPVAVVKKVQTKSDYFNTLTDNEADQKLIKAIIDENITAVDGSRVRLRLLDDVEINDVILYKGTYIYATMSGFGSQRVKGSIKSLMVEDDIVKVSLSIYDTDGLEGLYVPSSSFRDTGKDIASGVMSNTATINNGTYANNFAQWGMQAAQNAYQQASSAISKAVKKNRAKLKYGTFVYLINSNSK